MACSESICARVLAGCLLKVIASVVGPDQTCGVQGSYIGENVAFLRDVVELANEYNLPVALLSLDQEKAFDRVDRSFLFATLAKMGFGDNFLHWVRLLYTDIWSSVLVNGYTSRPFKSSRGVCQGCPLSPLLYVLSIEVLAANVRCHPDITGLRLPGFPSTSLYCPYMLMIRLLFHALIVPLERSSPFMLDSNKALVPSSILVNVRVFGWVRGVVVWMHPSPSNGPLPLLKSWVCIWVMAALRRKTGGLESMLLRNVSILGVADPFHTLAKP